MTGNPAASDTKASYIFHKKTFDREWDALSSAFSSFPRFEIAYSMKTNSSPLVISSVKQRGGMMETVSPEEYSLAQASGFEPSRIILNGVASDRATVEKALKGGGIFNADNDEDLALILALQEEEGKKLPVGLRYDFETGTGIASRFGFKEQKLDALLSDEKFRVRGLHCNFTHAREVSSWKCRAEEMCLKASSLKEIEYLDFGGGMHARSQKDLFEQYAQVLFDAFRKYGLLDKVRLIIEPGTPLARDSFDLLCTIRHIKDSFIITDTSIFDLGIHANARNLTYKIIRNEDVDEKDRVSFTGGLVTGYTCMEHDVMVRGFNGKAGIGDQILFTSIGDYSVSWANAFIKPPLEVVSFD